MMQNEKIIADTIEKANAIFVFDIMENTTKKKYAYARIVVILYLLSIGIFHEDISDVMGKHRTTLIYMKNQYENVNNSNQIFIQMKNYFNKHIAF